MEYEVDLRRYALAITRRWRMILICALLFAIVVGGLSLLRPRQYVAVASVLLLVTQTSTQISPNETVLKVDTIDVAARRSSLIALAQATAIEEKLPADVIADVAPQNYKPGMLLADGHIVLYPVGELLEIRATGETPEQAKALADAWATVYLEHVTPLYTDEHSDVRLASTATLPFRAESRSVVRNTALAGVAGLLFGLILALVLDLVRRPARVYRRVEGERVVGEPAHSG